MIIHTLTRRDTEADTPVRSHETDVLKTGQSQLRNRVGKRTCLMVFLRAPQEGRVKTRLARKINPYHALGLYKCFAVDILKTLQGITYPIRLFYTPSDAEHQMRSWLGNQFRYLPQDGADLGQRMANAFKCVFAEGFEKAVLTGSDLPDLPAAIVFEACKCLDDHGAVIGPSRDGGYYLIGFKAAEFFKKLFEDMTWGAAGVFEETLHRLHLGRKEVHILPLWRDIDDYSDLEALYGRCPQSQARQTRAYLATTGLMKESTPKGSVRNGHLL